MEERPAETNANVDSSASPSVAQLAGRFREQAAAAKEKSPPNASHPPKVKVKSSPLIEKLQANLTFDPAALLPGASPKSPGLKAVVSPFHSPPSTPSSPGVRSRGSEAEEVPVSFDQPPEGSHLPCYNKVRTRGSIKRRPPSRRFRRSQSDCGDLGDLRGTNTTQENGAKEENGDEVFLAKSRVPGTPLCSGGAAGEGGQAPLGPGDKPPLRRTRSEAEKQEERPGAREEEDPHCERAVQNSEGGTPEPSQASSPEAESGHANPKETKPAEEQTEGKGEQTGCAEAKPGLQSPDSKKPEEGAAVGDQVPQSPPAGMEDSDTSKQDKNQEKQAEEALPEPGCSPRNSHTPLENNEVHNSEPADPKEKGDALGLDTKM
ncbi:capZ-interacting protein isoform X2 [Ochotona curzoniae]|uniref:capZ-interacting protein isoform X2 n=1 Tax=Ochotona curzoniae TaxID=130825 RepID=UPI001B352FBD|nr:capZ-interacting protein isoform X2 [Ochotona curzoniae]